MKGIFWVVVSGARALSARAFPGGATGLRALGHALAAAVEWPAMFLMLSALGVTVLAGTLALIPLVVHLLAPNHRPIQITSDLKGFWLEAYPKIKKELQRKYPKHEWR